MTRTVKQAIDAIPKRSTKTIAEYLKKRGIKGVPTWPGECPIARYLHEETGTAWLIGISHADEVYPGSGSITLPVRIRQFVKQFDRDEFPELRDNDAISR